MTSDVIATTCVANEYVQATIVRECEIFDNVASTHDTIQHTTRYIYSQDTSHDTIHLLLSFCGTFHIFISILVPTFTGSQVFPQSRDFEQISKFYLNSNTKKLNIQIICCLSPETFFLFSCNSIKLITKSFHRQQFLSKPASARFRRRGNR